MVLVREGKPGDAFGIAKVHVDSWQYAYRGLVKEEFLNNLSYEKTVQTWEKFFAQKKGDAFIFVASDSEKGLVGFISGGVSRDQEFSYEGEIYAIYVAPDWQGKGIGKRLLEQAKRYFKAKGKGSFYLWTLASSRSRRFYEACGGEWRHQKVGFIGGGEYELAGYVWGSNK